MTSQLNKQDADSSLFRQFGTNDRMLRYRRLKSIFFMDTFFVTFKAKSVRGYTMMQLFVSDKGFLKVFWDEIDERHTPSYEIVCQGSGCTWLLCM